MPSNTSLYLSITISLVYGQVCDVYESAAKITWINSSDTHAFKPRIGVELVSTTYNSSEIVL